MMWNNTCRQKLPKCFVGLFATLRTSEVKLQFKMATNWAFNLSQQVFTISVVGVRVEYYI